MICLFFIQNFRDTIKTDLIFWDTKITFALFKKGKDVFIVYKKVKLIKHLNKFYRFAVYEDLKNRG